MKFLVATLLMVAAPGLALAQPSPASNGDAHRKARTKAEAKAHAKKKTPRHVQKAIEESVPVDDDPAVTLTPAQLETAKHVFVGDIPCELGQTVHITPQKREGFFIVRAGIQRFRMHPVDSRTGAIRLEDDRAGAMWLQLGNKSMLMSQKMGRRLADECMSPTQAAANEALKKNPPPSLLEPLPPTKVAAPTAGEPKAASSAEPTAGTAPK